MRPSVASRPIQCLSKRQAVCGLSCHGGLHRPRFLGRADASRKQVRRALATPSRALPADSSTVRRPIQVLRGMSSGGAGRSSGGSATVAPARAVAEATIDADDATAARLRALFEEHGFVIVRGVLPDDAVDAAKRGCAGLVQAVFDAAAADGAVASASAAAHLPLEKRLCELRSRAHTPLLCECTFLGVDIARL